MKVVNLKNDIELGYKQNINTPRVALCFNFSLNDPNSKPGAYTLMSRLFMQGTKTKNAEELANELEKYAIEFSCDLKMDYLKLKFVCLNEDFEKALEIFEDIIKNSTFDDWEKEKLKLAGEIQAQLDSPRAVANDNYYKNIYSNHHYGYTSTVILEHLESINKEDILNAYKTFMTNSKKVIAFVGDLEFERVYSLLNEKFGNLDKSINKLADIKLPELSDKKEIVAIKSDTNQAHIIQGWLVDTANSEDYATLSLLNIILGASGLSSRLFLELRDKKGLAYVVRSSYDMARLCANFSIYIATEPKNIEISLNGFKEELDKIKTVLVSDVELKNAVNNLMGKWAFFQEDNSQQASSYAHYAIVGLGFDFNEKAKKMIKSVTPEQIKNCANKYFNDKFVVSIIKP